MTQHFDPYACQYASLSVKDLLDARNAYHLQLSRSTNVFATAIGLYRIRQGDPDSERYVPAKQAAQRRGAFGPRTLENAVVRPWSWPCVLVFVERWLPLRDMAAQRDQVIPPFLWLPDGRVVPVCTLQASLSSARPVPSTGPLTFSSHVIGGGYPVLSEVQGVERVGSIGCLVTDGDRYYALTNQHVAGGPGREISTLVNGARSRIGASADRALRTVEFGRLYPQFTGAATEANLDVGLIEVDDLAQWTAQVFGLGVLGEMIDFNDTTASLTWIGLPVVAHGGASGRLAGEIKALFYRYRSVNGTDYVSDFLIGGRGNAPLTTGPGDSGTLWCADPTVFDGTGQPGRGAAVKAKDLPPYRPLAVEWGGQKLWSPGGEQYTQYVLASAVSPACRELDVEIVTDLNAEHTPYWGAVGHYKIAQLAIDRVESPELKAFLRANLAQLSYDAAAIATGQLPHDASQFVPLADVPDIVWKANMNRGSKAARPQENWNHYADMDLPGADGKTLFDVCGDPPVVKLQDWLAFYTSAPAPAASQDKVVNMGSLPFRVWQIFEALLDYRRAGDAARFLCAAGVLAPYVGDACQPLHSSMHADGLNGASTGVHSVYEEKMVDVFAAELRQRLDAFDLGTLGAAVPAPASGYQAAQLSIQLMRRAHTWLPPATICTVFNQAGGGRGHACVQALWAQLAAPTVACLMDGTRVLAALWTAAYLGPGGKSLVDRIEPKVLQRVYEDPHFLPSLHLRNLNPAEYQVPAGLPAPVRPAVARKGTKPAVPQPGSRRNAARAIGTQGRT